MNGARFKVFTLVAAAALAGTAARAADYSPPPPVYIPQPPVE